MNAFMQLWPGLIDDCVNAIGRLTLSPFIVRTVGGSQMASDKKEPDKGIAGAVGTDDVAIRVNLFAVSGAAIGILSLFGCWQWTSYPLGDYQHTAVFSFTHLYEAAHRPEMLLGEVVFLAGSLIAFRKTFGAAVQFSGLVVYCLGYLDLKRDLDYPGWDVGLGLGFWAAVFATSLVVAGFVFALMTDVRPFMLNPDRSDRLTTVRTRGFGSSESAKMESSGGRVTSMRKAGSVIVSVLLIACLSIGAIAYLQANEAIVQEIDGGVGWTLDFSWMSWSQADVWIHDDDVAASWSLEDKGLDNGTWAAYTASPRPFGEQDITLTVVDSTGNGIADYGDTLIFMIPGSSFESGKTYHADITNGMSLSWSGWELEFEFQNGRLASYSVHHVIGL
jgi:hypothetical protein